MKNSALEEINSFRDRSIHLHIVEDSLGYNLVQVAHNLVMPLVAIHKLEVEHHILADHKLEQVALVVILVMLVDLHIP